MSEMRGVTPGAVDVLNERLRQVSEEGWSEEHDDAHDDGEMAEAGACYALFLSREVPRFWPWADEWWKPTTRRRNLVKAAALIIAEIDRLDRAHQYQMAEITATDEAAP